MSDAAKKAARTVTVTWDDGSTHTFRRDGQTHNWSLAHKTPDDAPLNVTGYDQFQVTRVLVNCLDGDA